LDSCFSFNAAISFIGATVDGFLDCVLISFNGAIVDGFLDCILVSFNGATVDGFLDCIFSPFTGCESNWDFDWRLDWEPWGACCVFSVCSSFSWFL